MWNCLVLFASMSPWPSDESRVKLGSTFIVIQKKVSIFYPNCIFMTFLVVSIIGMHHFIATAELVHRIQMA